MPGICFAFDTRGLLANKQVRLADSLASLSYDHRVKSIILEDDHFFLGASQYEHYEIVRFDAGEYSIFIEGRVYNRTRDELEQELSALAEIVFENPHGNVDRVKNWTTSVDGEFLVLMVRRAQPGFVLFNDPLGHLPLYSAEHDGLTIISREIGFIKELLPHPLPDRKGLAQLLLFSFPLGTRTLLTGVKRLLPGTMMVGAGTSRDVRLFRFHQFNFEEKTHAGLTRTQNIHNLIDIFGEACRQRADMFSGQRNVLSLSGGLDSRAVAAGLFRNSLPFEAITYLDRAKTASNDVTVAEKVAQAMHASWSVVSLDPPRGGDFYNLLRMKLGLNYLGMGFILPYLNHLRNAYGPDMVYFSGDTGMVLRDYRSPRKLGNIDDIVKFIFSYGGRFSSNSLFSLDEVSAILDLKKEEIIADVRAELESYPERDMNQKYVHFTYQGYCFNWHYEGIDRNRSYFWPGYPLESYPFFNYAMHVPDGQKKYYRFYREFLAVMFPESISIDNATWGAPVDSSRVTLKSMAKNLYLKLPSGLKEWNRNRKPIFMKYNPESSIQRCFARQLSSCSAVSEYISFPGPGEMIPHITGTQFSNLFTATSLIEYLLCGKSSLKEFENAEMM